MKRTNQHQKQRSSHVRHINPLKEHPERITKEDKKLVKDLNYDGLEFPV